MNSLALLDTDASPLPDKRYSVYVNIDPSWIYTPQVEESKDASKRKHAQDQSLDQVLENIEAPRFLDFENMIKQEEVIHEEKVQFGKDFILFNFLLLLRAIFLKDFA